MEVRDVVVTGGTGRLGRRMVDRLRAEGIEPRVMSRSGRPGTIKGDLLTGEVIEAAVRGADTIIHAAQSPTRKSRQTAVEGTERLLEIAGPARGSPTSSTSSASHAYPSPTSARSWTPRGSSSARWFRGPFSDPPSSTSSSSQSWKP